MKKILLIAALSVSYLLSAQATSATLKDQIDEDITNASGPGVVTAEIVGNALTNVLDQAAGYDVFVATLTQTGTSAPVVTVEKNTLGYTPTIGYVGVGTIGILMTGLNATKTQVIVSPKTGSSKTLVPTYSISSNTISLKTYNLANSAFENDMLVDTPIEIRVYE